MVERTYLSSQGHEQKIDGLAVEVIDEREQRRRIQECERMKWIILGDNKPITWHEGDTPGVSGWFWNFAEDKVWGDKRDVVQKPNGYGQAVSIHEFAHVKISQPTNFTQKELGTRGFLMGYNWVEDNAVENFGKDAHNEGREFFTTKAEVSTVPGGNLDYRTKDAYENALGYLPDHAILGGMMRQYFFGRELTGELNVDGEVGVDAQPDFQKIASFIDEEYIPERVKESFKKVFPYLEKYYNAIPTFYDEKSVIDQKAQEREKIYRDHIWPVFEELYGEVSEEQTLMSFVEALIEGEAYQSESGGPIIIIDFDSLPEDVKKELTEFMDQMQQNKSPQQAEEGDQEGAEGMEAGVGAGAGSGLESGSGETGEAGEGQGEAGSEAGDQAQSGSGQAGGSQGQSGGQPQPGESTQSESAGAPSAGEASNESSPSEQGTSGTPPKWTELSEETKKAVEEAFDTLSEESKAEISESAEQALSEADQTVSDELQPHTDNPELTIDPQNQPPDSQDNPPDDTQPDDSGESAQEPAQQPTQDPAPQEVDPEALSELEQYFQAIESSPAAKSIFERSRQKPVVKDGIEYLQHELEPLFKPKKTPQKKRRSSGAVLDIDRARRFVEHESRDDRIFETLEKPIDNHYRFTIIVDLSSSMDDIIGEVFDIVVILAEVFRYLGIELQIVGFTNGLNGARATRTYHTYTQGEGFGDVLAKDEQAAIGRILQERRSGTPTSQALLESYQMLQHHSDNDDMDTFKKVDFFMVLTDGEPTDSVSGLGSMDSAKYVIDYLQETANENDLDLLIRGYGLGRGSQFVDTLFSALPEIVKIDVAAELSRLRGSQVSPAEVGNSFNTVEELVRVLPILIEDMIQNPDEYRS